MTVMYIARISEYRYFVARNSHQNERLVFQDVLPSNPTQGDLNWTILSDAMAINAQSYTHS